MEKTAVLPPMPRASVRITASEKPGLRQRPRAACLTSRARASTWNAISRSMSRSLECHRNTASTRRMNRGDRRGTSRLLLERAQHARDDAGQPQPAVELALRRAPSLPGQRVELGGAIVPGGAPLRRDEALFFHAI